MERMDRFDFQILNRVATKGPESRGDVAKWFGLRGPRNSRTGKRTVRGATVVDRLLAAGRLDCTPTIHGNGIRQVLTVTQSGYLALSDEKSARAAEQARKGR